MPDVEFRGFVLVGFVALGGGRSGGCDCDCVCVCDCDCDCVCVGVESAGLGCSAVDVFGSGCGADSDPDPAPAPVLVPFSFIFVFAFVWSLGFVLTLEFGFVDGLDSGSFDFVFGVGLEFDVAVIGV